MTVFKNYFRIVNRRKFTILMYSVVFMVLTVVFSQADPAGTSEYRSAKIDLYIENNSDSTLANALESYLVQETNVVELNPKHVDDELFYGLVQAVVTIPEDFETSKEVEYKSSPKSMYGYLVTQKVNDFLNKVQGYESTGYSLTDAIKFSNEDLKERVEVGFVEKSNGQDSFGSQHYFNFMHYVLMSQIILIITSVMVVYNKEIISKRNEVSPVSKTSQNLQLTLGHVIIGFFVWLFYIIIFFVFWPEAMGNPTVHLLIFNSFIFMISVVTLAVLLSKLIMNENSLSAILNVVTLGTSFLAGAFVPQELLSDFTLNLSRVFPSYYYITNNNLIANQPTLSAMLPNALVMILFSIGFVMLTIFVKPKVKQ